MEVYFYVSPQVQPQHKLVNLRLSWFRHAQGITHNVAKTCRYYGVARRTYYFWWNRYQRYGLDGLKNCSRLHIAVAKSQSPEIIEKIVYLWQRYYLIKPFQRTLLRLGLFSIVVTAFLCQSNFPFSDMNEKKLSCFAASKSASTELSSSLE
jgi:hypothetical protein